MRAEDRDDYTITEYARFWRETERQAYRLQEEFRELWPEYVETNPTQLALQIVKQGSLKLSKDKKGNPQPFDVSVEVTA
jgi:Lhr-like helicase